MNVRKITIPTITLLIIASQLMGCASATQKEMLNMINNNQSITIEIATPISQEQGTEKAYEWQELASLTTYPEFRDVFDDTLNITTHGNAGKNGIVYVDLDGNHTNNSTLMYAFMNQKFLDNCWNNTDAMKTLIDATKSNYVDVETDGAAKVAMLNAYFNMYPDAEPNYFNGNQTLTRAEFLAGTYRAGNPVSDIQANADFVSAVDTNDDNENNIFASQMLDYSYLTLADKSLNNGTYEGTISRAEAVYTLVQMFYSAEYEATTGEEAAYSDTKNGGDIASKMKFIETDKKTGTTTEKDYWKSYELSYAIQTPDKGMPDDLYRAMVVAKNHNLINGTESRWDEGLTKGEAINLLVRVYEDMTPQTNADRGASSGEVVVSIDFKDIDPDTHATYNASTGEITVDDTMVDTFTKKSPYFLTRTTDKESAERVLTTYLKGYYTNRFDGDDWLQFAITGDTAYLNFEVSDQDIVIQTDQELDAWKNSEEGQAEFQADTESYSDYEKTQGKTKEERDEEFYKQFAEEFGMTIEEVRALANGGSNGGGGSTPVATPETNQSAADENSFVTPETSQPSTSNPAGTGSGGDIIDWEAVLKANAEAAGDGGKFVTNGDLNP